MVRIFLQLICKIWLEESMPSDWNLNAEAFANRLSKVFTPNQITPSANVMQEVNKVLGETAQYTIEEFF